MTVPASRNIFQQDILTVESEPLFLPPNVGSRAVVPRGTHCEISAGAGEISSCRTLPVGVGKDCICARAATLPPSNRPTALRSTRSCSCRPVRGVHARSCCVRATLRESSDVVLRSFELVVFFAMWWWF